jgi:branched-chain amino acid transport system permease protein
MEVAIVQILNGISFGGILFLLASGLSLIYGIMQIINIAHGAFYMLAGYVGLSIMWKTGNFWLSLLVGTVAMALLGIGLERGLLRKVFRKPFSQMLLTMGFALIFRDVVFIIWGGDPYSFPVPGFLWGSLHFGNIVFPVYRIFVALVALVVAAGLILLNEKTSIGAKMRACVDDRQMAEAVGINSVLVSVLMFGVGCALAGFGGVLGGPFFGVYIGADFDFLMLLFVVVIVGGFGSITGSLVGSFLVGLVDTLGKALFPELSYFTLFAPMALFMAFKPTGLFGKE